jgi:hypothetical protein
MGMPTVHAMRHFEASDRANETNIVSDRIGALASSGAIPGAGGFGHEI